MLGMILHTRPFLVFKHVWKILNPSMIPSISAARHSMVISGTDILEVPTPPRSEDRHFSNLLCLQFLFLAGWQPSFFWSIQCLYGTGPFRTGCPPSSAMGTSSKVLKFTVLKRFGFNFNVFF